MSAKTSHDASHMHIDLTPLSVTFRGVRGSASVFGAEYASFGGSTMCLEIAGGGRRVILDAGSGIQKLGWTLVREGILHIDILLTHFHVDHVIGLMSFAPLFRNGARVTVHAPILDRDQPADILPRLFAKPFFPIAPGDMGASFEIHGFHPGEQLTVAGFDVRTTLLSHPGGACGYRIGLGGRSVAVITDHEHQAEKSDDALAAFCAAADLVLYDAPWDEQTDYVGKMGWGHSTWQAGLRLLRASSARRLGCIHHAPDSTDEVLAGREAALQRVHPGGFFAREGDTVAVGGLEQYPT
jgi:phosphoribosyl 1,2-cyclic phosphodiesterase